MLKRLTVGPIGENVYIVPLDGAVGTDGMQACLLVDPGDEATRILEFLDASHLVPSIIALTHGHLDHTAALPALLEAFARRGTKKPTIAIHSGDAAYLGSRGEETNHRIFAVIRAQGFFKHYWKPLPEPDLLLRDGDFLPTTRWLVIHTPGHSAGSICLYDEGQQILISGDTLFKDGIGRTDCPDSSAAELARSLSERIFRLPGMTKVYPGHGDSTTIDAEKPE